MRRLQRSDMPLVDAVVGNAGEANLPARPGLNARPLDALVKVVRLAGREMIDEPGETAGTAGIRDHASVIVPHPLFRIDDFPILIAVGRAARDIWMLGNH